MGAAACFLRPCLSVAEWEQRREWPRVRDARDSPILFVAGRTALHRALGGGFAKCAEFLIEKGADPNQADTLKRTALHWAAMGPAPGNVECCDLVFTKGDGPAMLAKTTKSGSTPLHSAAGTNRPEVVEFLVSKGADQTAKDDDELTAYDLAKVRATCPLPQRESAFDQPLPDSVCLTCCQASGYDGVLAHLNAPASASAGGGGCCLVQ